MEKEIETSAAVSKAFARIDSEATGTQTRYDDPYEAGRAFASMNTADTPSAIVSTRDGKSVRTVARTVAAPTGPYLAAIPPENYDHRNPRTELDSAARRFHDGFTDRVQEVGTTRPVAAIAASANGRERLSDIQADNASMMMKLVEHTAENMTFIRDNLSQLAARDRPAVEAAYGRMIAEAAKDHQHSAAQKKRDLGMDL